MIMEEDGGWFSFGYLMLLVIIFLLIILVFVAFIFGKKNSRLCSWAVIVYFIRFIQIAAALFSLHERDA